MRQIINITGQNFDEYIDERITFSTGEIENMIFGDEYSPELPLVEIVENVGEFRLIGDELMKVDKDNIPPNSVEIIE